MKLKRLLPIAAFGFIALTGCNQNAPITTKYQEKMNFDISSCTETSIIGTYCSYSETEDLFYEHFFKPLPKTDSMYKIGNKVDALNFVKTSPGSILFNAVQQDKLTFDINFKGTGKVGVASTNDKVATFYASDEKTEKAITYTSLPQDIDGKNYSVYVCIDRIKGLDTTEKSANLVYSIHGRIKNNTVVEHHYVQYILKVNYTILDL